jgi:hypothetical protein
MPRVSRIVFKLLANRGHVHVYGPSICRAAIPNVVEQFFASYYRTLIGHQINQQVKLLPRQLDGFLLLADLTAKKVESKIT